MIVRKQPNGELVLIAQTDHSRLAGQLAAHWGNADFAAPDPYDSMVRAASFHDYGWLTYETTPLIDSDTGEPYSFLQVPIGTPQLSAYQWSLDWMTAIDPYAGLIISMHRTGLWQGRYGVITHPKAYTLKEISPQVRELINENEAWQEQVSGEREEAPLRINYCLMQIWDLLALYFCCDEPYEEHIEPVPTRYSNSGTVKMSIKPMAADKIAFDPFPFDVRPCRIQVITRRLPRTTYGDSQEFRRAYFGAPIELRHFELV